jgi:3-oxoacyl-[acyl-carrier-protein] synthase II
MANIFVRPGKDQRRVVVTGMSVITPVGLNLAQSWDNVVNGRSGIERITGFDPSPFDTQIAGEVKAFNPDDYIPKKEQKKMDKFIHYTLAAAKMAMADAELAIAEDRATRAGTIIGVGLGGLPILEKQHDILRDRGPSRLTPFFIPAIIANMASGHVSMTYNLKGPNFCTTSACASGAHAIGEGGEYIRKGLADIMVCGGAESAVTPLGIGGFAAMKAMSTRNDRPHEASRPWDRDRDGFVLSEGCGIIILEDYEHAKARGAHIYAELCGYGASSDAYHMTSPAPGGAGAAQAMALALQDGRIDPSKVGYINAHGTSTPAGDELEAEAVKRVFGDHAKKVWVSSTKSVTGHTLGAAGAIESVFAINALATGIVPPTINLDNPSEGCDLDFVPFTARERQLDYVLNNSFGFGGTNASILFGRV